MLDSQACHSYQYVKLLNISLNLVFIYLFAVLSSAFKVLLLNYSVGESMNK